MPNALREADVIGVELLLRRSAMLLLLLLLLLLLYNYCSTIPCESKGKLM